MPSQRMRSLVPSLVIVALTLVYLVTGYQTLDAESRHVPALTAWLTLFVLLLDLIAGWRGKRAVMPSKVDEGVTLKDEARALLSMIGLVAAVYFLGFYIGGALYLLVSLWWIGKQGLRFSLMITVIAFVCIYLLFEKALAFRLFRGMLFPEY